MVKLVNFPQVLWQKMNPQEMF